MAVLQTTNPTLADVAKALDPQGNVDMIVEMLQQTEEILEDMVWLEGNLPTGHRTSIRTGLPDPTWRKLYGGVQPTKSLRAQVTDNCGMLEDYAEIDKSLADLNGNTAAFRLSEDKAHIQGFAHKVARTVFYGNEGTAPETFTGLAPRLNALSGVPSSDNVINAGGTGSDLTSVWLVVWGNDGVHGIYPKGSKAGLQTSDKGQVTVENADGAGGRMEAYRTHYKWDCGLVVRDWRQAVRIANIKPSLLTKDAASGPDLVDLMTDALERANNLYAGRAAFYCNRTVRSYLRRQIKNAKNINLTIETVAGKRVVAFDGVPVRRCDSLTFLETAVA